jgi:putative ABC transport system permease protein
MGLAAAAVALVAGIVAGWAVMRFVMEAGYSVDWVSAFAILAGGVLATLVAGLVFASRPLAASPARVLRSLE